jgi:hypothetical protein
MFSDGVSIQQHGSSRKFPELWLLISLITGVAVLTQAFGLSQDWENYVGMFDAIRLDGLHAEGVERIEFGFKWLSAFLVGSTLSNLEVYAVISALSIFMKCAAISSLGKDCFSYLLAMLFYMVCIAPLHEFTQLRAAIAISALFLCYAYLVTGRFFWATVFALVAAGFHLSALLVYPAMVFSALVIRGVIHPTRFRVLFLSLSVFAVVTSVIAFAIAYFEEVFLVVSAYQELGFGDDAVNPLSPSVLLNVGFFSASILFWDSLTPSMRNIVVFQAIGLAVFFATMEFQVVAFRIFELFQAFTPFFVVDGFKNADVRVRLFLVGYVALSLSAYSYIYFFSGKFFL